MTDIHEHASPPVLELSLETGEAPGAVANRHRRSRVKGGRMCIMLLFNVLLAYAAFWLFLAWNDRQLTISGAIGQRPHSYADPSETDGLHQRVITPEISKLAQELMKKGDVPGLSVGVVRWSEESAASNSNVEFGSWGIMSEQGANVTADTLFNIGSCSKAFLAVSMGILMEDFRLGLNNTALPPGLTELTWDTRITDLLPADEWELANEWATKEANIGDILSHVSGLPRHDFAWDYNDTTLDIVKRLRYLKTTHGLRQEWDYNNQMYILGAHIISRYAGMPYTQHATKRVFSVLGMNVTTFNPSAAERSGILSDAWSYAGRRIPLWFGSDASEMLAGPGGVVSSAKDMTKWIAALVPLVTSLRPQDDALPARVVADVTQARAIIFGRSAGPGLSMIGYGMGWVRATYFGNEIVFHSGSIPGYRAIVILLPRKRAGVVALVNSDDMLMVHNAVAYSLIHSILGLPLILETPAPMFTAEITGLVRLAADLHTYARPDAEGAPQKTMFQRPVHLTPLEPYAGTYTNIGYGNVTFCAPSTGSAYCDRVRAAFALTHNGTVDDAAALLAEWPRLLATHIQLVHQPDAGMPDDTFWLTTHYMFPNGYGVDRSPFDYELFPPGFGLYAQCALGQGLEGGGCGVFLTLEAYVGRKEGMPLREQADVWFEKVASA